MKLRMTYTLPEQLRPKCDANGKVLRDLQMRPIMERVPQHPTRPARDTDWNCWTQDVDRHR